MNCKKGNETVHPLTVPLKVWIQIGIDMMGQLKEIYGYH